MYHELTYEQIAHRRRRRIAAVVACVLLAALVVLGTLVSSNISREQSLASVRDSVLTAASQCAAVEGSYPATVEYLEQHYGLTINHDHYLVYYEWMADNVPPSVTVNVR